MAFKQLFTARFCFRSENRAFSAQKHNMLYVVVF